MHTISASLTFVGKGPRKMIPKSIESLMALLILTNEGVAAAAHPLIESRLL